MPDFPSSVFFFRSKTVFFCFFLLLSISSFFFVQHVKCRQDRVYELRTGSTQLDERPNQQNPHRLWVLFIFTNPSAPAGYDTRSIFKRCLTGLNSEFSFSKTSCLTKAEEPSLSYYLPIAGGKIIGFIHFPRVLVPCEMQLAWSRI